MEFHCFLDQGIISPLQLDAANEARASHQTTFCTLIVPCMTFSDSLKRQVHGAEINCYLLGFVEQIHSDITIIKTC